MFADDVLVALATDIVANVARVMRAPMAPVVLDRDVEAACAVGGRWPRTLVNPDWLVTELLALCGDPGCRVGFLVGMLGHELGHLVFGDGYTSRLGAFRADGLATIALGRIGISPYAFADALASWSARQAMPAAHAPYRHERWHAVHALGAPVDARDPALHDVDGIRWPRGTVGLPKVG